MDSFPRIVIFLAACCFVAEGQQPCVGRRVPSHGSMQCTDLNERRSVCSFNCDQGYRLYGYDHATCNDKGFWSNPFPLCLPEVYCEIRQQPENGEIVCTRHFRYGSVCSYSCQNGYELKGSAEAKCDSNRQWSNPTPVCERKNLSCDSNPEPPAFGGMYCFGNSLGSRCYYGCLRGYILRGQQYSTCIESVNGADWTSPPTCESEDDACAETPSAPENGYMACGGKTLGSRCYFGCRPGYLLTGMAITSCTKTDGNTRWDSSPTCELQVQSCNDTPKTPEHGVVHCNGTTLGSHCYFVCDHGYRLMGMHTVSCLRTDFGSEWTPPPTCEPISTKEPEVSCQKADIVFLLDSSTYFGDYNWAAVKEYARQFINSFSTAEGMTRFSVLRYSSTVDTESEILLNDFVDDRDGLMQAYDKINDTLKEGLSTGDALRHVKHIILQSRNGDRANVRNIVILFSAHTSDDDVMEPARQLRQETHDTTVYVIGLEPQQGILDWRQLQDIAGSSQQFFNAGEGFDGLDEAMTTHMEKINIKLCRETSF